MLCLLSLSLTLSLTFPLSFCYQDMYEEYLFSILFSKDFSQDVQVSLLFVFSLRSMNPIYRNLSNVLTMRCVDMVNFPLLLKVDLCTFSGTWFFRWIQQTRITNSSGLVKLLCYSIWIFCLYHIKDAKIHRKFNLWDPPKMFCYLWRFC